MQTGQAPLVPLLNGDGQPRPPQVMLRWSNNGGETWSNTYFLSVHNVGEYKRVMKRMLGRARKRVYEVSWIDPIPWRFINAYLKGGAALSAVSHAQTTRTPFTLRGSRLSATDSKHMLTLDTAQALFTADTTDGAIEVNLRPQALTNPPGSQIRDRN